MQVMKRAPLQYKIYILVIGFILVILTGCSTSTSATPTLIPTATPVSQTRSLSTSLPLPTSTPTARPALTSSPTIVPSATPNLTPVPTPGPIKPIFLEFGGTGGDGGTSYDAFFGRSMPSIILYTDGELLIRGEQYNVRDLYVEKHLSTFQMCSLLRQIRTTGYFSVTGNGQHYPNDPIYQKSIDLGQGGGGDLLQVNGEQHKWVFIYNSEVDNLIPQVKAAYLLISKYHPQGMKPFSPDRIILRVEHQPADDWFYRPTPAPAQQWPTELPSLAEILKDQSADREVVFQGNSATLIRKLIQLPGGGYFSENGSEYFIVARPLLPHETLDYYSVLPWSDSSDPLPFNCAN